MCPPNPEIIGSNYTGELRPLPTYVRKKRTNWDKSGFYVILSLEPCFISDRLKASKLTVTSYGAVFLSPHCNVADEKQKNQ